MIKGTYFVLKHDKKALTLYDVGPKTL